MSELYIVIHIDQHTDPEVSLFKSWEGAYSRFLEIWGEYQNAEEISENVGPYLLYSALDYEGSKVTIEKGKVSE